MWLTSAAILRCLMPYTIKRNISRHELPPLIAEMKIHFVTHSELSIEEQMSVV